MLLIIHVQYKQILLFEFVEEEPVNEAINNVTFMLYVFIRKKNE